MRHGRDAPSLAVEPSRALAVIVISPAHVFGDAGASSCFDDFLDRKPRLATYCAIYTLLFSSLVTLL
jgi:hypothetical protein